MTGRARHVNNVRAAPPTCARCARWRGSWTWTGGGRRSAARLAEGIPIAEFDGRPGSILSIRSGVEGRPQDLLGERDASELARGSETRRRVRHAAYRGRMSDAQPEPIEAEMVEEPAAAAARPTAAPDYDEHGVPSFDYVRDKIENRYATSVGATELAAETPEARTLEQQAAERDREAAAASSRRSASPSAAPLSGGGRVRRVRERAEPEVVRRRGA